MMNPGSGNGRGQGFHKVFGKIPNLSFAKWSLKQDPLWKIIKPCPGVCLWRNDTTGVHADHQTDASLLDGGSYRRVSRGGPRIEDDGIKSMASPPRCITEIFGISSDQERIIPQSGRTGHDGP
jgi:hypothetical protein